MNSSEEMFREGVKKIVDDFVENKVIPAIKQKVEDYCNTCMYVEKLTEQPGATVTICGQNENAPPEYSIFVEASWPIWEERRFDGKTIVEALEKAVKEMDEFRASKT